MERQFNRSRDNDRSRGGNRGFRSFGDRGPQEKHKAICSACKKECEVPFKPTEGRDVFCTECWKKQKGF